MIASLYRAVFHETPIIGAFSFYLFGAMAGSLLTLILVRAL